MKRFLSQLLGATALFVLTVAFCGSMVGHASAAPGVRANVTYQARLMDSTGYPVADGVYQVRFSLYDAAVAGTRLWTAAGTTAAPAPVNVSVQDGLFTVLLGDGVTQLPFGDLNWNSDSLYLGVTIGADAEMGPRRPITAVPQAINSSQLNGMSASGTDTYGGEAQFTITQASTTSATSTRSALDIRTNGASVANDFILRGLNGAGSAVFTVNSQGSVTSSNLSVSGIVSTTQLFVGGQQVCLANGTNCLYPAEADTLESVALRGATTSQALTLFAGATMNVLSVTDTAIIANLNATNFVATDATTTNLFASGVVSTTALFVNGQTVCLNDGTNCPASFEIDSLASVTARGATTTVAVTFFGGVTSSDLNVTGTANVQALFWTDATGTNVTGTNAFFTNLRGSNASLASLLASSSIFSQATATSFFASVLTATNAGITNVTTTNLAFTNASGASMIVTVLNGDTLNASTSNIGSLTFASATGGVLDVVSVSATSLLVAGQQVCLANGTNCVSLYSTDTLAMITARGATTSAPVSFFGGVTSSNINVSGTANLANVNASSVNVSGGISVATGSIAGLVTTNATATNVTTTNLFAASGTITNGIISNVTSTNGFVTSLVTGAASSSNLFSSSIWGTNASFTNLMVSGTLVCLADGTNCSYPAGTDTLLTVTNRGSVATATLTLLGGAIANNITVTSTLTVSGTVSSDLIPTTDLTFSLGTPSLRWNGNFGNVTIVNGTTTNATSTNFFATNATATNLFAALVSSSQILVNGYDVCLSNGTNCAPSAGEADTLASVTARGATTSVAVTFFGGVTTTNLNASSALIDGLSWTNATGTNTTGTNAFFANLRGTTGSFSELYGASSTLGQATATAFFTQTFTATDAGIVNATATNLAFTNASGASMIVTVLNGSTINASTSNIGTATIGTANVTTGTVASLAFTNATGAILDIGSVSATSLLVAGQNVCLANGTNCVSMYSTDTLAMVTARGATTSVAVTFFGGVTSSNINVSGTANLANINASSVAVSGGLSAATGSIAGLTATNATATNVTTTNLFATNGVITNVTSTNGFVASLVTGVVSSTNLFSSSVWGTNASFTNLMVSGTLVCLADGTNCSYPVGTDTLLSVTNRGSVATATLSLLGGAIANNVTVTSTLTVSGTVSSDLIPTTDLSFSLGTPSLRWNGNFGNVTIVNGTTTNATSTNYFATTASSTNLFAANATIGGLIANSGSITNLNGSGLVYSNATFTNATATNLFASLVSSSQILVNGYDVCLSNGTNCAPSAGEADTLASVTARGATTSVAVTFFGGVTSSNINVSGTANLANVNASSVDISGGISAATGSITGLAWTNATGTNTTGTNAFFANLRGTTGSFSELYSASTTLGQATATVFFTQNFTATNTGITNATATNLAFTNASGASIIVTVLNAGTATVGTLTATTGTISSLTFTNATGSVLDILSVSATSLLVSGQQVCLANGNNCLSATTSLQVAYDNGKDIVLNDGRIDLSLVSGAADDFVYADYGMVVTPAIGASFNGLANSGFDLSLLSGDTTGTLFTFTDNRTNPGSTTNTSFIWHNTYDNTLRIGNVTSTLHVESDRFRLDNMMTSITGNNNGVMWLTANSDVANETPFWFSDFGSGTALFNLQNLNGNNAIHLSADISPNGVNVPSAIGDLLIRSGSTGGSGTQLYVNVDNTITGWRGLATTDMVCLSDGSNCLSTYSTDTLAIVTARGATTSVAVTFFGGVTTTNLNASSALVDSLVATNGSILGLSWTNATGTNTTGTNAFFANLRGTTGSFNELYSASTTLGQATATAFYTQVLTATDAGIVNATMTNLAFTNASGASMIVTVLNGSTVNASTSNIGTANVTTGTITSLAFTNATGATLSIGSVSATSLLVSGQNVCLANGTNCVSMYSTDTLAMVTARGATTSAAVTFFGGVTTTNLNATSALIDGLVTTNATATNVTTTNLFATNGVITNVTSTNGFVASLVTGAVSSTSLFSSSVWGTNASFTNILVAGQQVCLADGTNCTYPAEADTLLSVTNRGSVATATLSLLGGFTTNNATVTSTLTVSGTVSSDLIPTTDLAFSLGTPSLRWNGNFGTVTATSLLTTNLVGTSATFTNATATNLFASLVSSSQVLVGGYNVCLSNGTNCPAAAAEVDTLASVTARGATTSVAVTFFGGVTTTNLNATSALIDGLVAVNGSITSLAWTNATGTNTTGTNAFFANLRGTTGSFNELYSASTTLGQATATAFYTQTFTATNAGITNATTTNLAFTNASGASMIVTVLDANTATFGSLTATTGTIGSLVFTNATGGTLDIVSVSATSLLVSGQQVCLQDGTNCSSATTTLQAAYNNGNTIATTNGAINIVAVSTTLFGADLFSPIISASFASGTTEGFDISMFGGSSNPYLAGTGTSLIYRDNRFANPGVTTATGLGFSSSDANVLMTLFAVSPSGLAQNITFANNGITFYPGNNGRELILAGRVNFETGTMITSDIIPDGDGTRGLGNSSDRWNGFFNDLSVNNVTSVNVTANNLSAAFGSFTGSLQLGGVDVCLQNGINCPSISSPLLVWTTDIFGSAILTTTTQDVIIGNNSTYTINGAPFYFETNDAVGTSTFFVGYSTSANVVIGGTSGTVDFMNADFASSFDGNDLFVAGNIGSASSVYTNGEFVVGNASMHIGNGYIRKTDGDIVLDASSGFILPGTAGLSLGSDIAMFSGVFGNVTSTNATATTMEVASRLTVGGVSVCLADGTNCAPSSADLQTTYNAGRQIVLNDGIIELLGSTTTETLEDIVALNLYGVSSTRLLGLGNSSTSAAGFEAITYAIDDGFGSIGTLFAFTDNRTNPWASAGTSYINHLTDAVGNNVLTVGNATSNIQIGSDSLDVYVGNQYLGLGFGTFSVQANSDEAFNVPFQFYDNGTLTPAMVLLSNGYGANNIQIADDIDPNGVYPGNRSDLLFRSNTSAGSGTQLYVNVDGGTSWVGLATVDMLAAAFEEKPMQHIGTFDGLSKDLSKADDVDGRTGIFRGELFDLTNPLAPISMSAVSSTDSVIKGSSLYTLDTSGATDFIRVYDLTNLASPTLLGSFDVGSTSIVSDGRIAVDGSTVYYANATSVRIFDAKNPATITELGSTAVSGTQESVSIAYSNGYLVYTGNVTPYALEPEISALEVIDVRNPAAPVSVSWLGYEPGKYISVDGNQGTIVRISDRRAYVFSRSGGDPVVRVFDLANPALPVERTAIDPEDVVIYDFSVVDTHLFMQTGGDDGLDQDAGFEDWDISDPNTPVRNSLIPGIATAFNTFVLEGGYAFGPSLGDELRVIDLGGLKSRAATIASANVGQLSVGTRLTVRGEAEFANGITVMGKSVCLADGTNCAASSVDLQAAYNAGRALTLNNGKIDLTAATGTADAFDQYGTLMTPVIGAGHVNATSVGFDLSVYNDGFGSSGTLFTFTDNRSNPFSSANTSYIGHNPNGNNLYVGNATSGVSIDSTNISLYSSGGYMTINGANGMTQFVNYTNEDILYLSDDNWSIRQKLGDVNPENNFNGNLGDVYFRANSNAPGTQMYLKTVNGGMTGWQGVATVDMLGSLGANASISEYVGRRFDMTSDLSMGSHILSMESRGNYVFALQTVNVDSLWDGIELAAYDLTAPTPLFAGSYLTSDLSSYERPTNLVVDESYAYLGTSSTLITYDISDADDIRQISYAAVTGTPNAIAIEKYGNLLYELTAQGLVTFDVTSATNPFIVSDIQDAFEIHANAAKMKVENNFLYVFVNSNTFTPYLYVYSLANPRNPILMHYESLGDNGVANLVGADVLDGYAYVRDGINVTVLDVKNPSVNSSVLGSAASTASCISSEDGLVIANKRAYFACADGNLSVFDISNPIAPAFLGLKDVGIDEFDQGSKMLSVDGNRLFVGGFGFGDVIDIGGITADSLLAGAVQAGSADVLKDMRVGGRMRVGDYLAVGRGGIASDGDITVNGVKVCLADGTNCASSGENGSGQMVRLNPYYPVSSAGTMMQAFAQEDALYMTRSAGNISAFGVIDPANPQDLWGDNGPVVTHSEIVGNRLYTIDDEGMLRISRTNNYLTEPDFLGDFNLASEVSFDPGQISDFVVNGKYLMIVSDGTLASFDVSDPTDIQLVNDQSGPPGIIKAMHVVTEDNGFYFTYKEGLDATELNICYGGWNVEGDGMIDVGNCFDLPSLADVNDTNIALIDKRLFVQTEDSGESVINVYDTSGDFTNFINPPVEQVINPPGSAISSFKAVGNTLYVSSYEPNGGPSSRDNYFSAYASDIDTPYTLVQTINDAFSNGAEDYHAQYNFDITGKYALGFRYDAGNDQDEILAIDLGGIKTRNLYAANAGFGNVSVDGVLKVNGSANFANDITVRGVAVCLADGTNCPTSGGGGSNVFSADFNAPSTVNSSLFGDDFATTLTANSVQRPNAGMRLFSFDNGFGTSLVFTDNLSDMMDDPGDDSMSDSMRISYRNNNFFIGRQDSDEAGMSGLHVDEYVVGIGNGNGYIGVSEGMPFIETDTGGAEVLNLSSRLGEATMYVMQGDPNSLVNAQAGSFLLSQNGTEPGTQAYLKTTNGGTTGWQGIVTADMIGYAPSTRSSGSLNLTESFPNALDLQVTGTTAIVAFEFVDGGVQYAWKTVDLSDPANPTILYEDPGNSSVIVTVQVDGSTLYLVRKDGATTILESWDITDPSVPVLLDTLDLAIAGYQYNWAATRISGTKLYTATEGTLSIVDVTDPSNLALDSQLVGFTTHAGNRNELVVDGNYVYYTGNSNFVDTDVIVIDVSNPLAATVVGSTTVPGYGTQPYMDLIGTNLYVLGQFFNTIDISTPATPTVLDSASPTGISGSPSGFVIDGTDVYFSDDDHVGKYALADLTVETDSFLVTDYVRSQFIVGNYLVGIINEGLVTFELSATAPIRHFGSNAAWDGTFVNVSATNILVGGVAVCLQDGTNCPAAAVSLQSLYDSSASIVANNGPLSIVSPATGTNLYPIPSLNMVSIFGGSFNNVTTTGFDFAMYNSSTSDVMPTGTMMLFTTDRNNPFGGSATTVYMQADLSAGSIQLQTMNNSGLSVYNLTTTLASGSGGTTTVVGEKLVLSSANVMVNGSVASNVLPQTDLAFSLGSALYRWNANLGSTTATTLVVGGAPDPAITTAYSAYIGYTSSSAFGGLCIDDTDTVGSCPMVGINGASIIAEGSINANAYDLAERYRTSGPAEPGDVVIFDTSSSTSVKVSGNERYNRYIAGVVSTKPGFVLGWGDGAPIALSGRVPTKVSVTNGEIKVGDALTTSEYPGYAMKATKPGMILGYALEDVSATGTIEAFIDTGYNAMATLGTDGSIAVIKDDIVVMGLESASASTSTSDSFGLTFHGEGWDTTSSMALAYDFTLRTDMLSTTNARFVIENTFGSSTFSVDQDGIVRANAFEVNDAFDLAERYESADTLEPGDLVMISPDADRQILRTNDEKVMAIGVISTKAGFTLGANASGTYPVALAGRVPTKVTALNGDIKRGDALVASTIPGVAQKATDAGQIIGYALENYAGTDNGLIEAFIQPGIWIPKDKLETLASDAPSQGAGGTGAARQGFAKIVTGGSRVHIAYSSINAFPVPQVTAMGNVSGGWWLENVSDNGFDIVMDTIQPIDIQFAWQVSPSQIGIMQYSSDGTYGQLDPMTGQLVEDPDVSPESEPEAETPPESAPEEPPAEVPPAE